ncbi:hypothetical protein ACFX12_006234 [Malus domestica]
MRTQHCSSSSPMAVTKLPSLSTLLFFFLFAYKAASSPPTFESTKLQNQDQENEPFVGVNIGTDVSNFLSATPADQPHPPLRCRPGHPQSPVQNQDPGRHQRP